MATEKGEYLVGESPAYNSDHSPVHGNHNIGKEGALAEAADLYGSAADVERYGYVTRGLVFWRNSVLS